MKKSNLKYLFLGVSASLLGGCATNHDLQDGFILGQATEKNLAVQSIRSVDVPNSQGLTGQSGERAVAAIERLNSGEETVLSDVSVRDIGT